VDSPIRTIRVSTTARDQLIRLKRFTGIQHWNVLCRWALARSLAEPHPPSAAPLGEMSNIEMSWSVFAGPLGECFLLALRHRLLDDALPMDDETLVQQFRLHLHRGIAYLAGENVRKIDVLAERALTALGGQQALPFPADDSVSGEADASDP
jgi:DNA sulfur modification protein DndE